MKSKHLFFILLMGLAASCAAPKKHLDTGTEFTGRYSLRHAIAPAALSFVSGSAVGLNQVLAHHYPKFKSRFPGANDRYWKPELSWYNKYRNGDPALGPAYPGSTTFLVATTDAYHLTNFVSRGTLFAAGCTVAIGQRRPWWHYALDIGISYLAFGAGFHTVYSLYFK